MLKNIGFSDSSLSKSTFRHLPLLKGDIVQLYQSLCNKPTKIKLIQLK
uniref:Uncharacterized protein n=1 Tax=Lepeophtheirus salmonis TaxID=72036 RepID=A0A0K2UIV1_LEPSM